jgi:hypothetical protein
VRKAQRLDFFFFFLALFAIVFLFFAEAFVFATTLVFAAVGLFGILAGAAFANVLRFLRGRVTGSLTVTGIAPASASVGFGTGENLSALALITLPTASDALPAMLLAAPFTASVNFSIIVFSSSTAPSSLPTIVQLRTQAQAWLIEPVHRASHSNRKHSAIEIHFV